MPGAATYIAASWDIGGEFGSSNVANGGFYVTDPSGSMYYYNMMTGFARVPGGALRVAPTQRAGLFAHAARPNGNLIYYDDLVMRIWTQLPGSATGLSTYGTTVYVVGAGGGIYQTAFALSPTEPANHYVNYFVALRCPSPRSVTGFDKAPRCRCRQQRAERQHNAVPASALVWRSGRPNEGFELPSQRTLEPPPKHGSARPSGLSP